MNRRGTVPLSDTPLPRFMIRRNLPLSADDQDWLLISQVEHARISHQLAAAWKDLLPGAPAAVREELLTAILHHDDGWEPWDAAPGIDPEHGRPYGFTEMPPAEAQPIWSRSIDACLSIGPLAAWVVASHFIDLQDKQDDDFTQWARWLGEQDRRRAGWLADWLAADDRHSPELAEDCLFLLQTFDWLSLWLCCRAPVEESDPQEPLELGDASRGFGPFTFTPTGDPRRLVVDPWPFSEQPMDISAAARATAGRRYRSLSEMTSIGATARWRLAPD